MRRGERRSRSDARSRGCPKTFLGFASTCFLLLLVLLSELEVVLALEGARPPSSVSHVVVCRLFPYMALGAELDRGTALSWEEVGVAVAARTGLDFSAVGVL